MYIRYILCNTHKKFRYDLLELGNLKLMLKQYKFVEIYI